MYIIIHGKMDYQSRRSVDINLGEQELSISADYEKLLHV